MSYNNYSYRILCEDKRQYYLIKSFLECKKVNSRKIMLYSELPEGKSDAKQFVRDNYQQAVRNVKKNSHTILIAARDADTETYAEAAGEFDNEDNVFLVVSKRNIETWFFFIDNPDDDSSKDEQIDRKNNYPKDGIKSTKYGKKLESLVNDIRNKKQLYYIPDSLQKTIDHLLACEKVKGITSQSAYPSNPSGRDQV